MWRVFSIFHGGSGDTGKGNLLLVHELSELREAIVQGILLDEVNGLFDSLGNFVALIHLLNCQLVVDVLARAILHVLNLGKLDADRGRHLHHVVEWLLHSHELVTVHHA